MALLALQQVDYLLHQRQLQKLPDITAGAGHIACTNRNTNTNTNTNTRYHCLCRSLHHLMEAIVSNNLGIAPKFFFCILQNRVKRFISIVEGGYVSYLILFRMFLVMKFDPKIHNRTGCQTDDNRLTSS